MTSHRRDMTARVVPLRSREAGEPPCPATPSERIALVTRLSRKRASGRKKDLGDIEALGEK